VREPAATPEKPRGGVVGATIAAVVGVAILCGLGVWQVERKAWKEDLIATLNARLAKPPDNLPPRTEWKDLEAEGHEWRRVTFPAEFIPGEETLVYTAGSPFRPDVKGPGYWVFAPARLAGGSVVVIDRGFIPPERKDSASHAPPVGLIDIVGVMRWPEENGMFTPAADVKGNVWYARDLKTMAVVKQWPNEAPFYIEQEAPLPPGGLPKPGRMVVNLRDNHLQYAITWFGLALGLAAVYGVWLVRRRR
jgi:surfeit locus 1 family protein